MAIDYKIKTEERNKAFKVRDGYKYYAIQENGVPDIRNGYEADTVIFLSDQDEGKQSGKLVPCSEEDCNNCGCDDQTSEVETGEEEPSLASEGDIEDDEEDLED